MPDLYKQPYLDSSVYIAAIKDEVGRVDIAKHILNDAKAGKLQIVGSTFVIAEVIRGKGEAKPLSPEEERVIDDYVFHEFITWVELDVTLALDARRLARQHSLKPADAIHLASAIRGGADYLLRWDDRFRLADGLYEGVTVCEPFWAGQLEIENGAA
jgi:predicted nucleic acid-binding protein